MTLAAWGLVLALGCAAEPRPFAHPGGMHTRAQLAELRQLKADASRRPAYGRLLAEADRALAGSFPAAADFHQPSYYRHPDEPGSKPALTATADAAYALALAYQLGGGKRYAEKSAAVLRQWAAVNRSVSGYDGDLVFCYAGLPMILAADLLSDFNGWRTEDRHAFKAWVNRVFLKSADRIKGRANNWGDWGTFASIAARHFLDDRAGVAADVERLKLRIAREIAADGELPRENRRTNSGMWYTYFALAPMTGAANIARNATGIDLFHYAAPNGRTIKLALDRFFRYCRDPKSWPYRRPGGLYGRLYNLLYPSAPEIKLPAPYDWPGNLYEAMSGIYGEKDWEDWVRPHRPLRGGRAWLHPTLTR